MGRDAYLARVALGRSAFGPPLRDENGDIVLGGQARLFDDKSYVQLFNDRGHPVNPASEAQSKRYRKAQNEVLEACGVIIRKDTARKSKISVHEVTHEQQAEILSEENRLGFMLKCFDRFGGNLVTWWVSGLRGRSMTLTSFYPSFTELMRHDFRGRPTGFLFAGFLPWIVAEVGRLARRSEISEPPECMNYLESNLISGPLSKKEYLYEWAEWLSFLASELPFEIVSTLQALGFSVIHPLWILFKQQVTPQNFTPLAFPAFLMNQRLQQTIGLYLMRDYLYYQIGWRTYGLLRQLLIRPGQPTKSSVKMAEEDDFVDDDSIIGIGRSLGTYTDRRFYGPTTFWAALSVAFPWLSILSRKKQKQEEIKKKVLSRCKVNAEMEDDIDPRIPNSKSRAQNIIKNLEGLGVDLEHDFYVDIDQWTREIDDVESSFPPAQADHESLNGQQSARRRYSRPDSENPMFFYSEIRLDLPPPEMGIRRVVSIPQVAFPLLASPLYTPPLNEPGQQLESEITPRPVRRPTETHELDSDEEARLEWLANSHQQGEDRRKEKKKEKREYRMTRLTVFSAESFAWHTSSLVTSLVLCPLDCLYFSLLSRWFTSITGEQSTTPMIMSAGILRKSTQLAVFQQPAFVLLSFGIESVLRGILWQSASRIALYYGRQCHWGEF